MHLEDLRPCHDSPTGMPHSHQTSNCLLTQCEHMCLYINNIWANYKVSQDRTKLRGGTGSALSCTTKKLETFFVVQGGMLSVPPRFSNIVLVCSVPSACNCVFVLQLRKFTYGIRSPLPCLVPWKITCTWRWYFVRKSNIFGVSQLLFWLIICYVFCDGMICNATYFVSLHQQFG